MTVTVIALAALGTLATASLAIGWEARKTANRTGESFLAANRNLNWVATAFSIAATWVWAPALFVSAQQAYNLGLAGLAWFTVPNVLTLVLFAFFADKLRRLHPNGLTLSAFMRERHSNRVATVYRIQLFGLAIGSFAVNLLAGGAILTAITGIPFAPLTITLAILAVTYSLLGGIRASVATDYLQMALMGTFGLILVPLIINRSGGFATILEGIGGRSGLGGNILDPTTVLTFGIITAVGLLSGPFGDQSFYQRAFSIERQNVKRSFILGAAIFAIVPITMGTLGFIARGAGIEITNPQLTNVTTLLAFLPAIALFPFLLMVLSGLVSTLDSMLCSVSSITGSDFTATEDLTAARIGMLILASIGLAIALIPGITLLHLFLAYGLLRASTMLPTVLTVLGAPVSERGVFYGVLGSLLIAWPIFAIGNWTGNTNLSLTGTVLTLAISAGLALALKGKRQA